LKWLTTNTSLKDVLVKDVPPKFATGVVGVGMSS